MKRDLTQGPITGSILLFALPMMAGNLLQQMYNIADTWVVGHYLGADALAAVGSAYTLMTFLTSILLGLCMGSGAAVSMQFGQRDYERMRRSVFLSFCLIAGICVVLTLAVYAGTAGILIFLRVPLEVRGVMAIYLRIIFAGLAATFLYNYCATLLRAVGNSVVPLIFLAVSSLLNVALDLLCVLVWHWGVAGAAGATVFSQYISGIGILLYAWRCCPDLRPQKADRIWDRAALAEIWNLSLLTCLQQSIMNFGILMVQGLVNSFGAVTMAAFAAAAKIDSFAYMPVQDFGNAFSTYVAQNYGAGKTERIRRGFRSAGITSVVFSAVVSAVVVWSAEPLMGIFIDSTETTIICAGAVYLRIEGAFYAGIGVLFLLYGFYRAVAHPLMSVVLTVVSLGTRVILAYALSTIPAIGVLGIWWSVPIGWLLADAVGLAGYFLRCRNALSQ